MLKVWFVKREGRTIPIVDISGDDKWWIPVAAVGAELDYKTPRKSSMRTLVDEKELKTICTPLLRHGQPVCLVSFEGIGQWCQRVQARRKYEADSFIRWLAETLPDEMSNISPQEAEWSDASEVCAERSARSLRTRQGREEQVDELSKHAKEMPVGEMLAKLEEIHKWRAT